MTGDSPVTLLRREYDAIARQLEGAPGNAEREAAKREIIAYFKKVDGMLADLTQLKDEIRQLVDRYKQLAADTKQAAAPEFTGQRPAMHADHIGASTFIEKGWSLISLGDHAGAISSLQRALQRRNGTRVIAERYQTPSFLDERRGTDVIGMHRRPLAGKLRRRRLLRVGGELFVAVHELANLVLQLREIGQHTVDFLEVGDDLPLRGFALGVAGRALELSRDGVVLASQ